MCMMNVLQKPGKGLWVRWQAKDLPHQLNKAQGFISTWVRGKNYLAPSAHCHRHQNVSTDPNKFSATAGTVWEAYSKTIRP